MSDKATVNPQTLQNQGPNIDSILNEQRKFEPPMEFSQHAHIQDSRPVRAALPGVRRESRYLLVERRQRTALVQKVGQSSRMELSVGEVVRRRPDQSFLQLPRPPRGHVAQE